MIDLRSDTATRPTEPMRAAMVAAEVGDDVYDEDPTVHALQDRVADLFGFDAALFCATGSLANVLAVRHVVPVGGEILCEADAHVVRAELGAHAAVAGVTMRTWSDPGGLVDAAKVEGLVAPDLGPYFVKTAAISVENTHNFGGGRVQPTEALTRTRAIADEHGLAMHLDGARIWNAHVATGLPLSALTGYADVMAVCLSKGLGAPVGSLVLGSAEAIAEARVWRKRLGGGWRQAGSLAAAGLYALDHHIDRLADDHAHARMLAEACGVDPAGVDTNIVLVPVDDAPQVVARARESGVLVGAVGARVLRLVTHLDVPAGEARRAAEVLATVLRGS